MSQLFTLQEIAREAMLLLDDEIRMSRHLGYVRFGIPRIPDKGWFEGANWDRVSNTRVGRGILAIQYYDSFAGEMLLRLMIAYDARGCELETISDPIRLDNLSGTLTQFGKEKLVPVIRTLLVIAGEQARIEDETPGVRVASGAD